MRINNCEVCKKAIRYLDGTIKEGVIEYWDMYFCSDGCYKRWRTQNG